MSTVPPTTPLHRPHDILFPTNVLFNSSNPNHHPKINIAWFTSKHKLEINTWNHLFCLIHSYFPFPLRQPGGEFVSRGPKFGQII